MSAIIDKKALGMSYHVEIFSSASEVVEVSSRRTITNSSFDDMSKAYIDKSWAGVGSLNEALELMRTGYQPTVDELKTKLKANVAGNGKRISFHNDVVGFAPVVPLALQGIPTSMMNSYMKPIKSKVINIYYDMGAVSSVTKEQMLDCGAKVLAAVMDLETQGYKFNLYSVQCYADNNGGKGTCDVLCTKIKSSNAPFDLKRLSFALTHPAYFRVIGFDWYSKFPGGKFRPRYGTSLGRLLSEEDMQKAFDEIFNCKTVVFSCSKILKTGVDSIKNAIIEKGQGK